VIKAGKYFRLSQKMHNLLLITLAETKLAIFFANYVSEIIANNVCTETRYWNAGP
jgi:hypothetical protein